MQVLRLTLSNASDGGWALSQGHLETLHLIYAESESGILNHFEATRFEDTPVDPARVKLAILLLSRIDNLEYKHKL